MVKYLNSPTQIEFTDSTNQSTEEFELESLESRVYNQLEHHLELNMTSQQSEKSSSSQHFEDLKPDEIRKIPANFDSSKLNQANQIELSAKEPVGLAYIYDQNGEVIGTLEKH